MGKQWKQWQTLFSWAPNSLHMVTTSTKLKDACSLEEKLWQTYTVYKKQRHHSANKSSYSQSYDFSSSYLQMWELDHKEGLVPKNWCFQTEMLERTLESHVDSKKIQPVNPKGNQSWIFTGRTDAKGQTPVLWPPDVKGWLSGKDSNAGKDWGQGREGDWQRMRWFDGITDSMDSESEQTLGDSEGQGSPECCSPWGHKESDTTQQVNNNKSRLHHKIMMGSFNSSLLQNDFLANQRQAA